MRIIIRILIWSLLVGLLLTWLDWTPQELLAEIWSALRALPEWAAAIFGWAWPYIRQGAIIVVPVAVIVLIMRGVRGRRGPVDPQR